MHELLDAIVHLCDLFLTPFVMGTEPKKRWVKAVGLLIAAVGVIALLGLLAWAMLGDKP